MKSEKQKSVSRKYYFINMNGNKKIFEEKEFSRFQNSIKEQLDNNEFQSDNIKVIEAPDFWELSYKTLRLISLLEMLSNSLESHIARKVTIDSVNHFTEYLLRDINTVNILQELLEGINKEVKDFRDSLDDFI